MLVPCSDLCHSTCVGFILVYIHKRRTLYAPVVLAHFSCSCQQWVGLVIMSIPVCRILTGMDSDLASTPEPAPTSEGLALV